MFDFIKKAINGISGAASAVIHNENNVTDKQAVMIDMQNVPRVARQAVAYILNVGLQNVRTVPVEQYDALMRMHNIHPAERQDRITIFNFAKKIASLKADEIVECINLALSFEVADCGKRACGTAQPEFAANTAPEHRT